MPRREFLTVTQGVTMIARPIEIASCFQREKRGEKQKEDEEKERGKIKAECSNFGFNDVSFLD